MTLLTSRKLEEKPRTCPTVRWVDMQGVIRSRQKTIEKSSVGKDDSGDELDIDDADETEDEVDLVTSRMEGFTLDEDIDPNSLFLADLLSDHPQTDSPAWLVASLTEQAASDTSAVINSNW